MDQNRMISVPNKKLENKRCKQDRIDETPRTILDLFMVCSTTDDDARKKQLECLENLNDSKTEKFIALVPDKKLTNQLDQIKRKNINKLNKILEIKMLEVPYKLFQVEQ